MKVAIVISGMHRSGTTWLGRALGAVNGIGVVHEPFNVDHGVKNVPRWYLDHRSRVDVDFVFRTFDRLEAGKARYRWDPNPRRPIASAGTLVFGNRAHRDYRRLVKEKPPLLAIKDPFLLMQVPALVKSGIKTIVSVRHPGAILLSLRRMHWHIPNEHLAGRDPAGEVDAARDGDITAICAFWNGVYGPTLELIDTVDPEHLYIADHSLMFEDVQLLGEELSRFLGIGDKKSGLHNFLQASTSGETVNPRHNKQHEFTRDSKALAQSWRSSFSDDELALFDQKVGSAYAKLREWQSNR